MTIVDRITGIETSVALKAPCAVASLVNITLSGEQTVNGVAVKAGDRVLVTAQTTASENGIWVAATEEWARAPDFDGARDAVAGTRVYVVGGTTGGASMWSLETAGAISIGSTSLSFSRINEYQGGYTIDTLTELALTMVPAWVTSVQTAGYSSVGDGGGGLYVLVGSEPSHDGKSTSNLGTKWWELRAFEACPEQFSAAGDGATNDVVALNKLAAYQAATGAEMVLNNKWYGILTPWEFNRGQIALRGRSSVGHNTPLGGILKLSGFTGDAGIIVRANSSPTASQQTYEVCMTNVAVWGDSGSYREGDGFRFEIVSGLTLMNCQAQYHKGWGLHLNGCWEVSEIRDIWRFNGLSSGSGGGRYLNNNTRSNSNQARWKTLFNQNDHYQEYWDDGGDTNLRAASIETFGDLVEAKVGNTYAVAKYESGDRCNWVGTNWNQATGATPACLEIGDSGATETIDGLEFVGCYFQHNASTSAAAIITDSNIDRVEFVGHNEGVGASSKIIDATLTSTPGVIAFIGGKVISSDMTDPNNAITIVGGIGAHMGLNPGGAGNEFRLEMRTGTATPLRFHGDSDDTSFFLRIGDNSNATVSLGKYGLLPARYTAEPAAMVAGMIVGADRTNWDPLSKGSGGSYLVRRNDANSGWVAIDAQGA